MIFYGGRTAPPPPSGSATGVGSLTTNLGFEEAQRKKWIRDDAWELVKRRGVARSLSTSDPRNAEMQLKNYKDINTKSRGA